MSTQALEIQQPSGALVEWRSVAQVKARVQAIQGLLRDVLQKDVDYGHIPGMAKDVPPTLKKPGSEQILSMFQIAVEPIVEELSTDDCFRFRVITRLTHAPSGMYLGSGVGECSSNETKYKWKRTYSDKEFDETPADRRRTKYGRYKSKQGKWVDFEEKQIRQEPADLANTILKMAKKRSQIDGTLTVTGASSMFSQDLEDMPTDVAQSVSSSQTFEDGQPIPFDDEPVKETRAKSPAPTGAPPAQPQAAATTSAASAKQQPAAAEENEDPRYISKKQLQRLLAIQGSAKRADKELKDMMTARFGIKSRKSIPRSQAHTYGIYEAIVDFCDPEFKFHKDEFTKHDIGFKQTAEAEEEF